MSDIDDLQFYFIVSKYSLLESELLEFISKENIISFSQNPIFRTIQEIVFLPFFCASKTISIIYSYFGYALAPKTIKQITGSADSNLYFPEIEFWSNETIFERIRHYFVDQYRIFALKRAYCVVFESPELYRRSKQLFKIKKTSLILPSIPVEQKSTSSPLVADPSKFRILLVCGWQRNKNILLVPELASHLIKEIPNAEFIVTTELDNSLISNEFDALLDQFETRDNISLIGQVGKSQLQDLYQKTNCLLLLSKLESFSNNIIEAWKFKSPLVISNEHWARGICENSALYCDRDSCIDITSRLVEVSKSPAVRDELINSGLDQLKKYPSDEERFFQEIELLRSLK